MTQPIQEPMTQRAISQLTWGQNQLFRRPDVSSPFETAWIAAYDDFYIGFQYDSNDGGVDIVYPYIDWSDNAIGDFPGDGPFYYDAVDGSVFGETYAYVPQIMTEGLYAFHFNSHASSHTAAGDYKLRFNLNVGGDYPGRNSSPSLNALINSEVYVASTGWSDDMVIHNTTWILPVKVIGIPPEDIKVQVAGFVPTGDPDFQVTLRNKLWISYLGTDNYAGTSFPSSNDPGPYGS